MITVIYNKGDVLETKCDMICHQTNCIGVMGAGLALQIKNKYPEVFTKYARLCRDIYGELLGYAQLIPIGGNKYIANLFGQDGIGCDSVLTDYTALQQAFEEALEQLYDLMERPHKMVVAAPYKIGCGIAGGDWNIVQNLLINTAKNFSEQHFMDIELKIIEFEGVKYGKIYS